MHLISDKQRSAAVLWPERPQRAPRFGQEGGQPLSIGGRRGRRRGVQVRNNVQGVLHTFTCYPISYDQTFGASIQGDPDGLGLGLG